MSPWLRAAILVFATVPAAGCIVDSQAQIVREEKRFSIDGTPELHLRTFDGSIQIHSWESPEVVIEIEKRGPTREAVDSLTVESTQRGTRIDLEVKRPRSQTVQSFDFQVSTSAKLIVSVPRRADIVARTGDGSIRIERLSGRLDLRTEDGSIRVADVSGELILNTGDGSVGVDGAEGRLTLETGDGGVNVSGSFSAVKLHTGDGSVVFRVEPDTQMAEDWDITTGDGSVALYLPATFCAELDARTGDGRIRSELSVSGGDDGDRRALRGRLGSGGKLLRVRTGDGSINLRPR
jgi:DUF4097 and DUF4098 domain-containing protein YvlB